MFFSFLGDSIIDSFLTYYRSNFQQATITPKLHILDDHVIPFLREWRVGFGFSGEQGAESLHAHIKKICTSYASIPNRVERLKNILKEHHLQVSPLLVAQEPERSKEKKNTLMHYTMEHATFFLNYTCTYGCILCVLITNIPLQKVTITSIEKSQKT